MHVRCPHCHNPVEIVDEDPLAKVTCPSCGSQVDLVGDQKFTIDESMWITPKVRAPDLIGMQIAERMP